MIIVKCPSQDPYLKRTDYRNKSVESSVEHNGISYFKKITYEKKLNTIYRLGIGILVIFATLLVIPRCICSKRVSEWWNQAKTGIDCKIVLVKQKKECVRFNEQVQILEFHKNSAPDRTNNRKPLKTILKV